MGQRRGDAVKILFRAGLCFLLLVAQASAQNWPNRSVKLMVPTGPGAATDLMARLLADGVSRTIGQAIVVENVPAASGILAHQFVAHTTTDQQRSATFATYRLSQFQNLSRNFHHS